MNDCPTSSKPADIKTVAACTAAFNGALQALVVVLEDTGALQHGAFAAGLRQYIRLVSSDADPLTIALMEQMSQTPRDPTN